MHNDKMGPAGMSKRLALAALLAAAAPGAAQAQTAPARDNIDSLIALHARANKVPAEFVHRVVKRESNYNPRAKGGSALGLMQIKHATARGMGYHGDASGLFDPETNLKYGIAYLAGAYRAAQGNLDQAYRYYNRGYYYAAKKLGITTDVAETPAPAAVSSTGFASLFGLRTGPAVQTASADPGAALAYAASTPAQIAAVEVPLPPRRPASLGGGDETAPSGAVLQAAVAAPAPAQAPSQTAAAASDAVEVPLPPRRPSVTMLAAIGRPAASHKRGAPEPVMEAAAAPAQ